MKTHLKQYVVSYQGLDGRRHDYEMSAPSLEGARSAAYIVHGHGRAKVFPAVIRGGALRRDPRWDSWRQDDDEYGPRRGESRAAEVEGALAKTKVVWSSGRWSPLEVREGGGHYFVIRQGDYYGASPQVIAAFKGSRALNQAMKLARTISTGKAQRGSVWTGRKKPGDPARPMSRSALLERLDSPEDKMTWRFLTHFYKRERESARAVWATLNTSERAEAREYMKLHPRSETKKSA